MTNFFFNSIGMIGAFLCLLAYLLLQTRKLKSESRSYAWLNILGALGIIISLFHSWNLASFIMEVSWLMVGLYGLICSSQPKV